MNLSSILSSRIPDADIALGLPNCTHHAHGRLLMLYGLLVGPLLAGYMLFDKAFAYIHLPGTPLYVAEMVLFVGVLGSLAATGYLRVTIRDDPILAMLAAYFVWGSIRLLPGLRAYGIYAVRDFALVYYCLFAFFIAAALARSPEILERLIVNLNRFVPWLLLWLPFAAILDRSGSAVTGPKVPFQLRHTKEGTSLSRRSSPWGRCGCSPQDEAPGAERCGALLLSSPLCSLLLRAVAPCSA
jgi:hypothetical protein